MYINLFVRIQSLKKSSSQGTLFPFHMLKYLFMYQNIQQEKSKNYFLMS